MASFTLIARSEEEVTTMACDRKPWEPLKMSYIGNIGEVLQGGSPGKQSPSPKDPGETFKSSGGTG